MPTLLPFEVSASTLPDYCRALQGAIDGTGPAIQPYAGTPPTPVDPAAVEQAPDELALVVSTSGSTGSPKRAMLTRGALVASIEATHERLGGAGQWLLCMPAHHIAGTQVLLRSMRHGEPGPIIGTTFSIDGFIADTARLTAERRYTSLVPTQLRRLLDAGPHALAALTSYDGILLGGAATPPTLLAAARDAGVTVLTTYGMSETAGGCVYDGTPLRPTGVVLDGDGRITLTGATIASGYLGDSQRTAAVFGTSTSTPTTGGTTPDGDPGDAGDGAPDVVRTFRTDDIGQWSDGRLHVLGRIDDLITTGGLKVAPRVVEEAATALPDVLEAVALGLPDDEWGQTVGLAVRARKPLQVQQIRDLLRDSLPSYALPRRLLQVDELPLRGPGKPDRAALAAAPGWQTLPAHH